MSIRPLLLKLLTCLCLISGDAVRAQNRSFYLYNFPESDSCATWAEHRTSGRRNQALEGWVLGFVSGRNVFKPGNGNIAPNVTSSGLLGWMDLYCKEHPLDSVTTASFKLAEELERRARR